MAYGSGKPSVANAEEHLRNYVQKNLNGQKNGNFLKVRDFLSMQIDSVEITACSIASDEEGGVLKRQISDYMDDYPTGYLIGCQDRVHADIRHTFKFHAYGTDSCPFYYREYKGQNQCYGQ